MKTSHFLPLMTMPLFAFVVFASGLNVASGTHYETAAAEGFFLGDPTPAGSADEWHDRNMWFLGTSFGEDPATCAGDPSDTCGFGLIIPGLPTNYNPDYNDLSTVNPNDPGTSAVDPNALGANPQIMLDVPLIGPQLPGSILIEGEPLFIEGATIGVHPNFPGETKVVDVNHNVALGVRADLLNTGTGSRQTSLFLGAFGADTTNILNVKASNFSTVGRVIIGATASGGSSTINFTSGGTFQIGNDQPPPEVVVGDDTHSDATLIVGNQGGTTGIFAQTGGDVIVSGGVVAGPGSGAAGSIGVYNMDGGTLSVQTLNPAADDLAFVLMGVGKGSLGTFNQSGGTVTVDSQIVIGDYGGLTFFGNVLEDPGSAVYNITGVAAGGADGDYNSDGTVNAADYTVWLDNLGATAGTLPNDADGGAIGQAQYDTWKANFGNTAASGTAAGDAVLNQGVGTSNGGDDKGSIIVGDAGHGELNIDSSAGDVAVNANSIEVAKFAMTASTVEDSTGLVKIIGENATITTGSLTVGDGNATFEYVSASSISSIDVTGDVDIDGAALIIDLLTSPPPAGDLLLIDVGGALTGTFASLAEGAVVPGSGGRTISYLFGDGNDIGLVLPAGLATGGAIPEPTSAVLGLLAAFGFTCCRRR